MTVEPSEQQVLKLEQNQKNQTKPIYRPKKVYTPSGTLLTSNYYIRDTSGNIMAIYKANIDTTAATIVYIVNERNIYGSGHNATLNNISPINDREGNPNSGLKSAGNPNSYMEIADAADFDFGAGDFTVGIWVKKLKNFAVINGSWEQCIAVGKWHSGQAHGQNEWYLDITNGGVANNPPQFAIEIGTTKYTAIGTSALPTGSWYHLVGVREGTKIKLYVNGILEATKNVGTGAINNIAAREILIGKMDSDHYLEAGFDEFLVYHRALNATEVSALYDLGCGDFDTDGGEVASGGYRYGFNGQLKTDEISGSGNHTTALFWEYDTRLGRRWNLDPKPNPAISQYATFANNPIWFSDPLGDTIRINYTVGKNRQLKTMTYTPGMRYDGDNKFLSQTIGDLNTLNSGDKGGEMIGGLHSLEKDVTIMQSVRGSGADGFNVGFDLSQKTGGMDETGNVNRPTFIGLGHELAHVLDYSLGTMDKGAWYVSGSGKTVTNAEKFATHIENQIRAEHSIPLRTHYGLIQGASGGYRGDPQSRILNRNGGSLFYNRTTKIRLVRPDAGLWNDGQNRIIMNGTHTTPYTYK